MTKGERIQYAIGHIRFIRRRLDEINNVPYEIYRDLDSLEGITKEHCLEAVRSYRACGMEEAAVPIYRNAMGVSTAEAERFIETLPEPVMCDPYSD